MIMIIMSLIHLMKIHIKSYNDGEQVIKMLTNEQALTISK